MRRPPLRTVARLAGVSEPTVSRVFNGRLGVATDTRQRVVDVLVSMGFTDIPEPHAARRNAVGIVVGELTNPVYPTLVHHLARRLGARGLLASAAVVDDQLCPEERCIDELLAAGVDAMVIIGGRHAEVDGSLDHYRSVISARVPLVFVNGRATDLPVAHVMCDEGAGARAGVAHLVGLGHTRVGAVLGSSRFVPVPRMIAAWRSTMLEHGLEPDDDLQVETAFTHEAAHRATAVLLERGATALITSNDLMALGVVAAVTDEGRRVPDDVSVVGYDGCELSALSTPRLTTLRQPFEEMARVVVDAVQRPRDTAEHVVFEPELVVRDSTGPAPSMVATVAAGGGRARRR